MIHVRFIFGSACVYLHNLNISMKCIICRKVIVISTVFTFHVNSILLFFSFLQVVDESKFNSTTPLKSNKTYIVKAEWFWTSVQHEYRQHEQDFRIEDVSNCILQNCYEKKLILLVKEYILVSESTRMPKRLKILVNYKNKF